MASTIEVRERHKWHLHSLLKIKKANLGNTVAELQRGNNCSSSTYGTRRYSMGRENNRC